MKIRMETKQIILETRTDEDVIEITLAMIDLQVPVLHEPRYTDLGYESCFLCGKDLQMRIIHRKFLRNHINLRKSYLQGLGTF